MWSRVLRGAGIALLGLAVLRMAPSGVPTACADEPAAAGSTDLEALAARDPAARAAAAESIGATYPVGARFAPALAQVARRDADATVRNAAAAAVEKLAEKSLPVWLAYLADAAAGRFKDFGDVAEMVVRLGTKVTCTDLAAGLSSTPKDTGSAGVLGAVPLLVSAFRACDDAGLAGLDVLLESLTEPSRPRTAEVAAACKTLVAASSVRDFGTGAPGSPEQATVLATDVRKLLGAFPAGMKQPAGLREALYAVMGAVGRPDAESLEVLAKAAKDSLPARHALTRLGAYAGSLTVRVRDALPSLEPGRSLLLARLGERENPLPFKPPEVVGWFRDPAAKPERAAVEAYAREARDLASAYPDLSRRAGEALLYIARGDKRTPFESRIAAIVALGRSGRLSPSGLELLSTLSLQRRLPWPPKISGFPDRRLWPEPESTEQRAAGQALVALLVGAPESKSGAFGLAAILSAPLSPGWGDDLLETLPRVSARLARVRDRLVPLLGTTTTQSADSARVRGAVSRVLALLTEHDEAEATALHEVLAVGDGRTATEDLKEKDLAKHFVKLGMQLGVSIEVRRATVDALAACGPLARGSMPALEALRQDRDVVLRWHVERALTAIRE